MEKKPPQTKVKVVVRVRPSLSTDVKTCVKVVERNKIQIVNHRNTDENLQYEFSSVYNEKATQSEIFTECVEPLVKNTLLGQNVSIFAYGPTGAGKTHTMLGVMSDPGLIPRVLKSLFKTIDAEGLASESSETTVSFSYLEIYNEKVKDLLLSGNQDLPIREDASHNIFVAGLSEKVIDSFETFKKSFEPAASNRTVAATKLNESSSRSHSILMLKVHRRVKGKMYRGKIYLIDLAGSEDNRRTGNKGIRLKESGAINKSLFVLGEVVDAINHNLPRVPYRNSKLTRLLQDSIGGSCHSVMITNVAPEQHFYYDTYCTLNFATKSKKIVNVTTTTVKQDSPPVLVKPIAAVKPTKRRSLSQIPLTNGKKLCRASSASSSLTDLTTASTLPSSSVSRLQKELESATLEKTKALEKALKNLRDITASTSKVNELQQELNLLTSLSDSSSKLTSSQSTPALSASKRRSKRLSLLSVDSSQSPDVICPTPDLKGNPFTARKLRDTTNLLAQHHLGRKRETSKKLQLKKVKDDGPSCSPLFPDSPPTKKTATKRRASEDDTPLKKKTKAAASKFHSQSFQFQRNADFLEVLNTSSAKELQQLQTVGVKRAKLIYEWRQVHGPLDFVEGLKEIPGFTEKYIKNLLRSNMVTTEH